MLLGLVVTRADRGEFRGGHLLERREVLADGGCIPGEFRAETDRLGGQTFHDILEFRLFGHCVWEDCELCRDSIPEFYFIDNAGQGWVPRPHCFYDRKMTTTLQIKYLFRFKYKAG